MSSYKKIVYPDKSFYVEVDTTIKDITVRLNTYEDLWMLNQIVDVYTHNKVTPNIHIPRLIDAQADDRFTSDTPHGLMLVCTLLNSLDASYTIFHPHNKEEVRALLKDVKFINNSKFITNVIEYYVNVLGGRKENLILMSPDAGAFKSLMKTCDKIKWEYETHSATKSRKYCNGKSTLTQILGRDNFNGKDILIIDDICIKGGTVIGLSNLMKDKNIGNIYFACSHFTTDEPTKELESSVELIFTTNSTKDSFISNKIKIMDYV